MPRPSWDQIFLDLATSVAQRSSCSRARVGCVVTTDDHYQVLGFGYNGNYAKGPNVCDTSEEGNCGCIHAENNALIKVGRQPGSIIYTTMIPCPQCAKLIVNSGAREVVYSQGYRNENITKEILESVGVSVRHIPPSYSRFVLPESIGYNNTHAREVKLDD